MTKRFLALLLSAALTIGELSGTAEISKAKKTSLAADTVNLSVSKNRDLLRVGSEEYKKVREESLKRLTPIQRKALTELKKNIVVRGASATAAPFFITTAKPYDDVDSDVYSDDDRDFGFSEGDSDANAVDEGLVSEFDSESDKDESVQGEKSDDTAKVESLQKGTFAKHQVIVYTEKSVLNSEAQLESQKKLTKKTVKNSLKKIRNKRYFSKNYGQSLGAVGLEKKAVTFASAQKKLMGSKLGDEFRIDDVITLKDSVISLVSSDKYSTKEMIEKLSENPDIKSVYPNYKVEKESAGYNLNDPYVEQCYGLADETAVNVASGLSNNVHGRLNAGGSSSINATSLWGKAPELKKSEKEVVVAVVDSGVDYTHGELASKMWKNPGDITLNGTYGYDFSDGDDDPMDEDGHGTHCAGTIVAQAGNEAGISGVAGLAADDKIKIMALRAIANESYAFSALAAYRYILAAVNRGVNVRVVNNSWGYGTEGPSDILDEIFAQMKEKGILNVLASGNSCTDHDKMSVSPNASSAENIINVNASDESGGYAAFSDYGKISTDIYAPGHNILSTVSYYNYFPAIYKKKRLKKTTRNFVQFGGLGEVSTEGDPRLKTKSTAASASPAPSASGYYASAAPKGTSAGLSSSKPAATSQSKSSAAPKASGSPAPTMTPDPNEPYAENEGRSGFKPPVLVNEKGVVVTGTSASFEITDERYMNSRTGRSLKVSIPDAKKGETYYVVFPFSREKTLRKGNAYSNLCVCVDYPENNPGDGRFSFGDARIFKDHKKVSFITGEETGFSNAQINKGYIVNFNNTEMFSYDETVTKNVEKSGLALRYAATKDGAAVVYIDTLAVSFTDTDESEFGKYDIFSGTSMAAPFVAGAAAMLCVFYPDLVCNTAEEGLPDNSARNLKELVLSNVAPDDRLADKCATGGRLDLSKIVDGNMSPVLSDAVLDAGGDGLTLLGRDLGTSGKIMITNMADGVTKECSPESVVNWTPASIAIKEKVKFIDGSELGLKGSRIHFEITTNEGKSAGRGFYLVKGKLGFTESIFQFKDMEEGALDDQMINMFTDGVNAFGARIDGNVVWVDTEEKDIYNLSFDDPLTFLVQDKTFGELLGDYEENLGTLGIEWMQNPVYVNGKIFEWIRVSVSDRFLYVRFSLDAGYATAWGNASIKDDSFPSNPTWKIKVYEKHEENFSNLPPNIFRYGLGALGTYKGKIYAVGGIGTDGALKQDVYVFDPKTDKWTPGPALPEAAAGLTLQESNERLYAFLGAGNTEDGQPNRTVYSFNGKEWKILPTRLPVFLRTSKYNSGLNKLLFAHGVNSKGIVICGASTEGYGDTFTMITKNAEDISFEQSKYNVYQNLSTTDEKSGVITGLKDSKGKYHERFIYYNETGLDDVRAFRASQADIDPNAHAYYQIDKVTKGKGKGNIVGPDRIMKGAVGKVTYRILPRTSAKLKWVKVGKKKVRVKKNGSFSVSVKGNKVITAMFARTVKVFEFKNPPKKIKAGKKKKLKLVVKPKKYRKKVHFSSSNKKYATVNKKGVVKTKKKGKKHSVTITARCEKKKIQIKISIV